VEQVGSTAEVAEMGASSRAKFANGAVGGARSDPAVLRVKIRLVGVSRPPVWRRLLVRADMRLDRFHDAIQAAMGWEDYHLHLFSSGNAEYGVADPELGHRDERRTRLNQLLKGPGARIGYTYDFGDHWRHDITVEEVLAASSRDGYPVCLAGKGACPPEDCGGAWGYEQLREVLADPAHDQHEDMLEWLGLESAAAFDPMSFDIDEANEALALSGFGRR
jgi:Plasmid pRiA4b ORF-3-like protein